MWSSMYSRGTACSTMLFSMSCRRISDPVPGAPPLLLSQLTFLSAGLFLTFFFFFLTLFSQLLHKVFTSYIHLPRGTTILSAGLSCALWRDHLSWVELAVSYTGQPLAFSHRCHLYSYTPLPTSAFNTFPEVTDGRSFHI